MTGTENHRKRTWTVSVWAVVAALAVGLVGGLLIADARNGGGSDELATAKAQVSQLEAVNDSLQDHVWSLGRQNDALTARLGESTATPPAGSGEASATVGDGVYVVGVDIAPGRYRGTVTSGQGYWARLKNTDGTLNSVIANGTPGGPFELSVKASDYAVELRGVTLTQVP